MKIAFIIFVSLFGINFLFADFENCREKPFIDLWDTICHDKDWDIFPSSDENIGGTAIAPRSIVRVPTPKSDDEIVDFGYIWVKEWEKGGLTNLNLQIDSRVEGWIYQIYADCKNDRFMYQDAHFFSDIYFKNKINRILADRNDESNWLPSEIQILFFAFVCNRRDLMEQEQKKLLNER